MAAGVNLAEFVYNGKQQRCGKICNGNEEKVFSRVKNKRTGKRERVPDGGEDKRKSALSSPALIFESRQYFLRRVRERRR